MKGFWNVISGVLAIGFVVMAVSLFFKALFHPKYWIYAWGLLLLGIYTYNFAPKQKCHVCLTDEYIDGK